MIKEEINPLVRKEQWKMLFLTMFCYLFFYTGRHNFGWATKGMTVELGINFEQIGWISFSMLLGYAIGQFINGNLADRFSPKFMILTGGFLSVLCNIAISFSSSYWVILVLWTFNGYFQSMAWGAGGRIISNWWQASERGKAFGFYTMAAGSSSVLTFFLAMLLVHQDESWRSLFRYPVLFLFFALIVFMIFAYSHPKLKGFQLEDEESIKQEKLNWSESYLIVFKNKNFMLACFAIGFQSMARYGLIFWAPIHFLGTDYKTSTNNLWISLFIPIGMAIGALMFGILSDSLFKGKRNYSIAVGMILSCIISIVIYFTETHNLIWVSILMFLVGFFVYGVQSNFWTFSPDLLGNKLVGTGIGVMNMFAYVFAAIGEPIFGKVLDISKDSSVLFLMVSVICLFCSLIVTQVKTNKK